MSGNRHPFQRKRNTKKTVVTPFQKELVAAIDAYNKDGTRMSGRMLSTLLGKSANHISQILNDGFVPSGPAILDMARVLELDTDGTDVLIRAAMETKASQRSRDSFWITETTRMLKAADAEIGLYEAFLEERGLREDFEAFAAGARKNRSAKRSKRS